MDNRKLIDKLKSNLSTMPRRLCSKQIDILSIPKETVFYQAPWLVYQDETGAIYFPKTITVYGDSRLPKRNQGPYDIGFARIDNEIFYFDGADETTPVLKASNDDEYIKGIRMRSLEIFREILANKDAE